MKLLRYRPTNRLISVSAVPLHEPIRRLGYQSTINRQVMGGVQEQRLREEIEKAKQVSVRAIAAAYAARLGMTPEEFIDEALSAYLASQRHSRTAPHR
jgi:hypothetical protein